MQCITHKHEYYFEGCCPIVGVNIMTFSSVLYLGLVPFQLVTATLDCILLSA